MTNIAKNLSARAEFCLVVLVAFGYFALGSVLSLFYSSTEPALTNESLRSLVIFEFAVLSLLAPLLYARGWRMFRFGRSLALTDIGVGFALALVAYALYFSVAWVVAIFDSTIVSSSASARFVSADLNVGAVLVASAINPVFEELILCGYIVTVLKERRGFWTAVNVSLAIRLTCHLYQGAIGVISIVPLGFVFTYWYARTRRLWPVILAHALFDVVGLWPFVAK